MYQFHERFKIAMWLQHIKPHELSKETGFTQGKISLIANGKCNPTQKNLSILLNVLTKVDARWFMTGKGTPVIESGNSLVNKLFPKRSLIKK